MGLTELGTITMVAALIVDRIFQALKNRGIDIGKIAAQINELHGWHDMDDDEGVKIWYVRHSLEEAIIALSKNISLQTTLLDRIDRRLERIEGSVKKP